MDNLAKDAMAAKAKGMSYGRYMAQKVYVPVKLDYTGYIPCKHCGKLFKPRKSTNVYCDPYCQILESARIQRKKVRERNAKAKNDRNEEEVHTEQ
jgi:hypothetical protein